MRWSRSILKCHSNLVIEGLLMSGNIKSHFACLKDLKFMALTGYLLPMNVQDCGAASWFCDMEPLEIKES